MTIAAIRAKRGATPVCLGLSIGLTLVAGAEVGEQFRHLTASEIRARLLGKEVTDDVHWAYRFEPGGRLHVVSLGRARTAKWRLDGDGLCLEEDPCVQVWMAGNRIEFRRGDGTLPDEGVLQVPARRP